MQSLTFKVRIIVPQRDGGFTVRTYRLGLLAGKTAQPIGENLKSRLRRMDVTRLDASQTIECCFGSHLLEEIFWQVLQQLWVPRDGRQLKVVPAVAMSDF